MLDWQVNSKLSANVNWTLYGRQKPRQYAEIRNETGTLPPMKLVPIPSWVSVRTIS
jgi:outer membrane receptor for ferrienterochelin and colicin